jgi:hypothetical protein
VSTYVVQEFIFVRCETTLRFDVASLSSFQQGLPSNSFNLSLRSFVLNMSYSHPGNTAATAAPNSFPSTDFQQFIDSILKANATGEKTVKDAVSIMSQTHLPPAMKGRLRQDYATIIEKLLRERRELNGNYGWALASDSEHVYTAMGGKGCDEPHRSTRQWMRSVFDKYERTGQALADTLEMLRNLDGSRLCS